MEKDIEKELEEIVREALKPENRQTLLLAAIIAAGMPSLMSANPGKKSEPVPFKRKYCNLEDYLNSNEVKERIERNELELRKSGQTTHINYHLDELIKKEDF